jgi:dTDP-4-dehydrorhamnose reductase
VKVLVTGAGGLVGRAVSLYCEARGDQVIAADHSCLDITDLDRAKVIINESKPDVVINCAAWTDVDGCELDSKRAFAVNASGPENLALASRSIGAAFLTISTDYIFDGTKPGFYTQRDDPNPQSVYATAKLEGERRAQAAYARTIVVRSGFIFGPGGRNFLSTVVGRLQRNECVKAIFDSFGTPTYAIDLAECLRDLIELDLPGVFHVVNGGEGASYLEFARAVLRVTNREGEIESVSDRSLQRPAPRPTNSKLRCLYSEALGLRPLRDWQEALNDYCQTTLATVHSQNNPSKATLT